MKSCRFRPSVQWKKTPRRRSLPVEWSCGARTAFRATSSLAVQRTRAYVPGVSGRRQHTSGNGQGVYSQALWSVRCHDYYPLLFQRENSHGRYVNEGGVAADRVNIQNQVALAHSSMTHGLEQRSPTFLVPGTGAPMPI